MAQKKYYNHDHLWDRRHFQKYPVWGPHSDSAYHKILNRVLHLHPEAKTLFDAGCGAGALGLLAEKKGLHYIGADESSVAIKMGQASYKELDLRHHDMVTSAPEDCVGNISIATCVNVYHCLTEKSDRIALLQNLIALLNSDGLVALSTMCKPIVGDFRKADSPRSYLEVEQVYAELSEAGCGDMILRECVPADEVSPVTNILIVAKPG